MTTWLASVMGGAASEPAVRFCEGDVVDVLRACRLPKVEEVVRTDTIALITESASGNSLYWLAGGGAAHAARTLRLVRRTR